MTKKQEIMQLSHQQHTHTDDVLLNDLKEDLMTYYRENDSMIPASPLVDEHNVPIEELYVLPPMWAYDKPYNFGPGKGGQNRDGTLANKDREKQEITISQIFLCSSVRYKKIYVTANAGFGKTSLSQNLTMTWCQSHSPLTSQTENYNGEELAAMKYFDLLFLLHLRDYQSEPKCNLDDLIMEMVSEKLSRNMQYTKEFVQRILHKKKCCIILDGLDEWAHPGHCIRKPEIPHNNHPGTCTVLTTTRDWKIGTIGLSSKDIDRRVDMSMLDDEKRNLLEKNAFGILNARHLNLAAKSIEDFDEEVKAVQIGDIIYIPYILLQLMCLFFGGLPIGNSKCEIYSNITEFTLKRGLNKKNLPEIHVQSNDNAVVPNCMKKNRKCHLYFNKIKKLGKLAFCALFNEKRESSLIFDRKYAKEFITKQEIEFCIKVGLLCQTKDNSIIAEKRYHVFFQHKSVQEFFSAIYITSEWTNENVKSTILKICSSVSSTLEMENLFVFVCGMNPVVYACISGELQKIVDLDTITFRCRTDMYCDDDNRRSLNSYQLMQMQCLQESIRNGNESCPIYLYVVLVRYHTLDLTALKTIINFNKGHVKSLLSYYAEKNAEFVQSLGTGVFTSLETLILDYCDKEPVWLATILTESARAMKCLILSHRYVRSLSDISITALERLTFLQSLYLHKVRMTHSNLTCLYAYISKTTTLTQLKLAYIECSDHNYPFCDCDVTLDLHLLNELKMLHLYMVPCSEQRLNAACLEKLVFRSCGEMTVRASARMWQDLHAAQVLSSLTLRSVPSCQEMIQTIPTFTELKFLHLDGIDMGDVTPRFFSAKTKLDFVELRQVTMTSDAWKELLLSVGQLPHPVTVELSLCEGPSRQEWHTVLNAIKSVSTLSLLPYLSIESGAASLTLKNKTV